MSSPLRALLIALVLAACDAERSESATPGSTTGTPEVAGGESEPAAVPSAKAGAAGTTGVPRDAAAADGSARNPVSGSEAGTPADSGTGADDAGTADDDAGSSPPTAAGCADCCPDGVPRGKPTSKEPQRRLAAFTPSPADVATCPDGRVFLTLDGPDEVVRVPVAGSPEHYAAVTGVQPAGIACDEHGHLFVIAFSLRSSSPFTSPGVLRIGDDSKPQMLPPPSGGDALLTPNGIAAVRGIGLYTTDTLGGVIALIRERNGEFETTVVARDMLGVNGVAYDGSAHKLYVSNSVNQRVTSFAVAADGTLSVPKVEWTAPGFAQLDGMAVDELGRPYVAGYGQSEVLRLPEASVVANVANPASLAFRGGALLVVDYHLGEPAREGGLYSVELGACGAP